ncbi:MAG TPA: hypothetical protein ENJ56_00975 [Anaerolineae bacterium]|nr:hypothetical protein [Anaerolineae bacterium]
MTTIDSSQIPVEYVQSVEEAIQTAYRAAGADDAPAQRRVLIQLIAQVRDDNMFVQPDSSIGYISATQADITAAIASQSRQELAAESEIDPRRKGAVMAGLIMLIVLLGWFMWRSRPSAQAATGAGETTITQVAASVVGVDAEPTPTLVPLPPVSQDALAAIDGNGERLTLGEPSLLEIIYSDDSVSALPVSPAGLTDVGALRYQAAVMLSETPVAVWLANTRLNYGIGIPRDMIRRLSQGDRITIFTNTGSEIHFLVQDVTTRKSYQTTDILKQDRIGLALFALPASSDDEVAVAFAVYDVSYERELGTAGAIGSLQPLGALMVAVYDTVQVNQLADGRIEVSVQGMTSGDLLAGQQLLVNVTTNAGQQSGTSRLMGGDWSERFILPATAQGQTAIVEIRLLPSGELVSVQLPALPDLAKDVTVTLYEAWWQPEAEQAHVVLVYHNAGRGRVWLPPATVALTHPDGAPLGGQLIPLFPLKLEIGETVTQTVSFVPTQLNAPVIVRVGDEQWEVSAFPQK